MAESMARRFLRSAARSTSGARSRQACSRFSRVSRPSSLRRFFSSMMASTMSAACSSVAPAAKAARMQSARLAMLTPPLSRRSP